MRGASWALSVLALLAGFLLRAHSLACEKLWSDEAKSTCVARLPLHQAITPRIDSHPPLCYVILHLWARWGRMGLSALRFVLLALSLPMIGLAYRLGRHLAGRDTGTPTAWLVALSPLQVYYVQELRMYSLAAMLGMASVLWLVRLPLITVAVQ